MSPVAVLLVFLPLLVQAEIDWRTEPKWGFQFVIGSDGELECNDSNARLEPSDTVTWLTPNQITITGSSGLNNDKYQVIDKNNVNGMVLKIKKISDEDHGVYVCTVERNNVEYVRVVRALNLYEPAYSSKIDKYRYNIMVGGIAAAVFFIPVAGACFIEKFRYKSEDRKKRGKEQRERAQEINDAFDQIGTNGGEKVAVSNSGYENEGFDQHTTRL